MNLREPRKTAGTSPRTAATTAAPAPRPEYAPVTSAPDVVMGHPERSLSEFAQSVCTVGVSTASSPPSILFGEGLQLKIRAGYPAIRLTSQSPPRVPPLRAFQAAPCPGRPSPGRRTGRDRLSAVVYLFPLAREFHRFTRLQGLVVQWQLDNLGALPVPDLLAVGRGDRQSRDGGLPPVKNSTGSSLTFCRRQLHPERFPVNESGPTTSSE